MTDSHLHTTWNNKGLNKDTRFMLVLSGKIPMSNKTWRNWESQSIPLLKSKFLGVFKLAAEHDGSGLHSKNQLFCSYNNFPWNRNPSHKFCLPLVSYTYIWCMWTHGCWRQFLPWMCRRLHEQIRRHHNNKARASTSHQLGSHPQGVFWVIHISPAPAID